MAAGTQLVTIRGIPIRAHWSLFLALGLFVLNWGISGVWAGVLLFASVLAHELGHAIVAQHYGIRIGAIHLHLLGGAAMMEDHPKSSKQELWIAAAGPAVSLLIGLSVVAVTLLLGGSMLSAPTGLLGLLSFIGTMNLALGVFNLVPALPMDGGRIFRAGLTPWLGDLRATRLAAQVARAFAVLFVLGGLAMGSWTLPLIGVFVFMTSAQEERRANLRDVQRRAGVLFDVPGVRRIITRPADGGGPIIDLSSRP